MRRILLLPLLLLAGCAADRTPPTPTANEQRLIEHISRDPFVVIERLERDESGRLVVATTQGSVVRRYRLEADVGQGGRLRIHRLQDEAILSTTQPERIGLDVELRHQR